MEKTILCKKVYTKLLCEIYIRHIAFTLGKLKVILANQNANLGENVDVFDYLL